MVGSSRTRAAMAGIGAELARHAPTGSARSPNCPAPTRPSLTPQHREAARIVGLDARGRHGRVALDAIGNVVGRYDGERPGAAGAAARLASRHGARRRQVRRHARRPRGDRVRRARCTRAGRRLPFAIEVIGFGDEEGVRFQSTLLGSRAVAGTFDTAALDREDRRRRHACATRCGVRPRSRGDPHARARAAASVLGYLELHIEQGPVLEADDLPVGVVTSITGGDARRVRRRRAWPGHAGTVPMNLRRDALAAAAEMRARHRGALPARAATLVGTVGQIASVARRRQRHSRQRALHARSALARRRRARRGACADIVAALRGDRAAPRRRPCASNRTSRRPRRAHPGSHGSDRARDRASPALRRARLPSGAGHDAMAMPACAPSACCSCAARTASATTRRNRSPRRMPRSRCDVLLDCAASSDFGAERRDVTRMSDARTPCSTRNRDPQEALPRRAGARALRQPAGRLRAACRARRASCWRRSASPSSATRCRTSSCRRTAWSRCTNLDRAPPLRAGGRRSRSTRTATWCRPARAGRTTPTAPRSSDGWMYGRGAAVSKSDFATYAFALLALEAHRRAAATARSSCTSPTTRNPAARSGPAWLLSEGLTQARPGDLRRLLLRGRHRAQRLPAAGGRPCTAAPATRRCRRRASMRCRRRPRSSRRSTRSATALAAHVSSVPGIGTPTGHGRADRGRHQHQRRARPGHVPPRPAHHPGRGSPERSSAICASAHRSRRRARVAGASVDHAPHAARRSR